jgi:hypothetical protein
MKCQAVSPKGTPCKLEEGHYSRLVHMGDGPEMTEAWEDDAGRAAAADPRVKALRKDADDRWVGGDKAGSTWRHDEAARLKGRIRDEILKEKTMSEFRPGKYVHYKGGHYSAIMLVAHHETREPMVVYVSHEKGNVQVRELRQPPREGFQTSSVDAWTDVVEWPDGEKRPRFVFLGDFK